MTHTLLSRTFVTVVVTLWVILESPQSRRTDYFSNIVADREFSTGCYLFTVSNSGLLSILSVC